MSEAITTTPISNELWNPKEVAIDDFWETAAGRVARIVLGLRGRRAVWDALMNACPEFPREYYERTGSRLTPEMLLEQCIHHTRLHESRAYRRWCKTIAGALSIAGRPLTIAEMSSLDGVKL